MKRICSQLKNMAEKRMNTFSANLADWNPKLILNFSGIKNYTLIIIVFLSINSCTKDKVDNSCHSPNLLSQVKSGDAFVNDLVYNSNCQVLESVEPSIYKKFSYDSQNRLVKLERALSFSLSFSCVALPNSTIDPASDPRQAKVTDYYDFEYDNSGKLTKKTSYFLNNGNAQLSSYQTFTYENGQVVKLSNYSPLGTLNLYHIYEYDISGNVMKDNYYLVGIGGETKIERTSNYEYDNKNNPYAIFSSEGEPGKYTNPNNITKETTVWYSGTSEYKNELTTVYEYNTIGFPVKSNGLQYVYGE